MTWRRLIKRMMAIGLLLLVGFVAIGGWAHRQTKKVPEFYERAVTLPPPEQLAQSSEQLQANVEKLQTDVHESGEWQASFATEQVNAWLIEQLPLRFPKLQAKGVQDPRVLISEDTLTAAARYKDPRLNAVLSCQLRVRLTDQPNRLAIYVDSIHAGALPLPLSQFKSKIARFAERAGLELTWETRESETVALVDVPSRYPGLDNQLVMIESIELSDDGLHVAGRTGDLDQLAFSPQGPIYEIASTLEEPDPPMPMRNVQVDPGSDGPRLE